jgi:polyisoprenoid-binding protein YceI
MTHPVSQHPAQPPELPDRDTAVGTWIVDPTQSQVTFASKHFWGAITVRGSFDQVSGEAVVAADGTITGHLSVDTSSVNTKNKKRDEHLRSSDFFHAEQHPHLTVTVTSAEPTDPAALTCHGTLEAAGHVTPIEFTARVEDSSSGAITLRADLTVDRTDHAMTWNPLGMAAKVVNGTAVVRFARS